MHLHQERREGEATELVMVHGLTRRWQTFTPLLPGFQTRYSLTLLDLPGHGESDPHPKGYQVIDYAEAFVAWMDQFPIERFALYGHSLGAMVVLHAAAERPQRVERVILEDPPFETMGKRLPETIWISHFSQVHQLRNAKSFIEADRAAQSRMLAEILLTDPRTGKSQRLGSQRDPSSLRFMAACMMKMQPEVVEPVVQLQWLEGWDWAAAAARVQQPTLILRADEQAGGMLIEEDCQRLCTLLAEPVPVFFPGAGHNLHWLRTQDVCNSVFTFLDS